MAAVRIKVKMESSAGTGTIYTTTKNPRTTTQKLSLKKYDRRIRKYVIFNEKKIK